MKNTRALALKRESLAELNVGELGIVNAGTLVEISGWTCPVLECVNSRYIPCTV